MPLYTTSFPSLTVSGNSTITGDLTVQGTGKAYRLRRSGSALDFEGTGADILFSNWSDASFGGGGGSQNQLIRLASNALAMQLAGKVEVVDALYGAAKHTLDATANKIGFFGATPATKATVTGAKGSNAALASLLTALVAYGIVTDSTTA
jgi:hypothetical protein